MDDMKRVSARVEVEHRGRKEKVDVVMCGDALSNPATRKAMEEMARRAMEGFLAKDPAAAEREAREAAFPSKRDE